MRTPLCVAVTLAGGGRKAAAGTVGLASWLAGIAPAAARGEVSVAIVTDARMRVLNRTYRGKDVATDVLAFAADTVSWAKGAARSMAPKSFMGDIVIAAGVADRQAREAGHTLRMELRVLALHGLLHLAGYDHETDDGRMARVEARLRTKGGLGSGLIERRR